MLFRVLGPLAIEGAELTAGKPRRLLVVLLREANTWVAVDRLVHEVWGDTPPSSAEGNLKTYVSRLRGLSPEFTIERLAGQYRLTVSPSQLDSLVFAEAVKSGELKGAEEWERVLGLWRGRPFATLDCDEVGPEEARLVELRLAARSSYAEVLVRTGRLAEAIAVLRELTAEDPLCESSWLGLVAAYAEAGRRSDALAAFQQARRAMIEHLGVEPGSALQQLHAALLRDPALQESPAAHQTRRRDRRPLIALTAVVALIGVFVAFTVLRRPDDSPPRAAAGQGDFLFGIGDQATIARTSKLAHQAPISMLTTWYHGAKSLPALEGWSEPVVQKSYADGYALQLIVGDWDPPIPVSTKYGAGCGKAYPLSPEFLTDMRTLARVFAGSNQSPALYVTLFSGVDTYGCTPGDYGDGNADTNYYRALKDRYREVREIFRSTAPNARVGIAWHSWPMTTPDGVTMVKKFADVLSTSDYQAVISWEPDENVTYLKAAVRTLSPYGPVMVAQYGSDDIPTSVMTSDLNALLAPAALSSLRAQGLFAWNFDTEQLLERTPGAYPTVLAAVRQSSS
ncbi:BTAD domain-containing putative transcriptional regulator [Kribbella sp. NPDC056861]|uniref:AfsR/SARP family transcriptional regulator n=1 Tax=Kribbella sp. NPDC056861 TaxID=3154857 RepID=UPI00344AAD90